MNHTHCMGRIRLRIIDVGDWSLIDKSKPSKASGSSVPLEYTLEYCLGCDLRKLDGKPILKGIVDEFDEEVIDAKAWKSREVKSEVSMTHLDFEALKLKVTELKLSE